MAESKHSTSAPGQQPGLRSFIVYDRLPHGLASYPVTSDDNLPHLRAGDFVVVDPTDRVPTPGELFLIKWETARTPQIVETIWMDKLKCWGAGGTRAEPMRFADGRPDRQVRWIDFGYTEETMSDRLLGRVVGILEAAFDAPMLEMA